MWRDLLTEQLCVCERETGCCTGTRADRPTDRQVEVKSKALHLHPLSRVEEDPGANITIGHLGLQLLSNHPAAAHRGGATRHHSNCSMAASPNHIQHVEGTDGEMLHFSTLTLYPLYSLHHSFFPSLSPLLSISVLFLLLSLFFLSPFPVPLCCFLLFSSILLSSLNLL